MAHDDRRLNYEDRVERQLQGFLKSLPFEDGHAKYDKFLSLSVLSSDSDETNWLRPFGPGSTIQFSLGCNANGKKGHHFHSHPSESPYIMPLF